MGFNMINKLDVNDIQNIKETDLNARKYSDNTSFKSLELLMGSYIGHNRYLHDYKKYNINFTKDRDKLEYFFTENTDENDRYGWFKENKPYNLFDAFMNVSSKVYKEYSYEVVANGNTYDDMSYIDFTQNFGIMNRVKIPVYVDNREEHTTPERIDYIQLIKGLDIEISYLEPKELLRMSEWNFDAFMLFDDASEGYGLQNFERAGRYYNKYAKPYNEGENHYVNEAKTDYIDTVYRHKYIFDGYNRWYQYDEKGVGSSSGGNVSNTSLWKSGTQKTGVELLHYEYSINSAVIGYRTKYTRHRNSLGNHQYRTKVTFMNTVDESLHIAEKLNNLKYLKTDNAKYDTKRRLNLITHQDMVWGINKGMIAPNIYNLNSYGADKSSWSSDISNLKYVMTYIPNYPTVYIGFEEEYKRDLVTESTGMKKIGNIVLTFLNFSELGLDYYSKHMHYAYSQNVNERMYKEKRTCDDFSENSRFNIKIKVPKRDTNLIYKGQNVKGDEIFLVPGYLEYDNDVFVKTEYGFNKNDTPFEKKDQRLLKNLSISSDSNDGVTNKDLIIKTCGLQNVDRNVMEKAWLLRGKNLHIMHTSTNDKTIWRTNPDSYFSGTVLANYGGWVMPPFRLGAINYNFYGEYFHRGENFEHMGTTNSFSRDEKDFTSYHDYNIGCYHMCARDYIISLAPINNKLLVHF